MLKSKDLLHPVSPAYNLWGDVSNLQIPGVSESDKVCPSRAGIARASMRSDLRKVLNSIKPEPHAATRADLEGSEATPALNRRGTISEGAIVNANDKTASESESEAFWEGLVHDSPPSSWDKFDPGNSRDPKMQHEQEELPEAQDNLQSSDLERWEKTVVKRSDYEDDIQDHTLSIDRSELETKCNQKEHEERLGCIVAEVARTQDGPIHVQDDIDGKLKLIRTDTNDMIFETASSLHTSWAAWGQNEKHDRDLKIWDNFDPDNFFQISPTNSIEE